MIIYKAKDFNCSEITCCTYKRVGFDIEYEKRILGIPFRGEPGVTPYDIIKDNDMNLILTHFLYSRYTINNITNEVRK